MDAICNFIPVSAGDRSVSYHHFVYEADLDKLKQPFIKKHYCMHLAYKGEAQLVVDGNRYQLSPGAMFITFPYQKYELIDFKNFTYLYITFDGPEAEKLISQFGIHANRNVFLNFSHVIDFWMTSIRRSNPNNLLILTESVLLHTLSYVPQTDQESEILYSPQFDELIRYINSNFADKDLSLGKLADMFNFSRKYLSSLFARNMSTKFSEYLNRIRIEHAIALLEQESPSVKELAQKCGFSDPLYFSKVFKQINGKSPTNYKKGVQ